MITLIMGDPKYLENHTGNTKEIRVNSEILPWCKEPQDVTLYELRPGVFFGSAVSVHTKLVDEAQEVGWAQRDEEVNAGLASVILKLENNQFPPKLTDPITGSPNIYYNKGAHTRIYVAKFSLYDGVVYLKVAACLKNRENNVYNVISSSRH